MSNLGELERIVRASSYSWRAVSDWFLRRDQGSNSNFPQSAVKSWLEGSAPSRQFSSECANLPQGITDTFLIFFVSSNEGGHYGLGRGQIQSSGVSDADWILFDVESSSRGLSQKLRFYSNISYIKNYVLIAVSLHGILRLSPKWLSDILMAFSKN